MAHRSPTQLDRSDLQSALAEWLSKEVGGRVNIARMTPLAGGASRQSWAVDLAIESGSQAADYQLVLRRDLHSEMQPDALSRAQEFRLLQVAYGGGVQVPQPRWAGELEGRPFLLMDRVEGESIGARVVRLPELAQARAALPEQLGRQLARIHALNGDLAWLPGPAAGQTPAAWTITRLRGLVEQIGIQNPAYELALRWLEANRPDSTSTTPLHGDYRIGNVIVGPDGLRAVIDWEFAHRGDPAEDLAWPGLRDWRFGNDALDFGGVGRRAAFYAAYQAVSGVPVNHAAVRYWEVLGNVRWAIGCLSQAQRHLSGQETSIELASLGRRAAEMELEFLRLIERAEAEPAGD